MRASLARTLFFAVGLLRPSVAFAQASATLLPFDPAHRDVERLVAAGLADSVLVGQRPYSRTTIARAVRQATGRIGTASVEAARARVLEEVLERLRRDVGPELSLLETPSSGRASAARIFDRVNADATSISSGHSRRIFENNGLGGIDAAVSPFASGRGGRVLADGDVTSSLETTHELRAGRSLTLLVEPRFAMWDGGGENEINLERAYGRLVARNLVVQLGRDHLLWGQGDLVGSFFSASAPAIDMIMVGHERPLVMPWILRYFGPTRWAFTASRLDGAQNFPNPYLIAYKANALPARWFEIGASIYTKGGGKGGPEASFGERVADAIALVDVIFKGDEDFQFSDKYAGGELRFRIDRLASMELYGEILLNDLDFNRFASSVSEDASHVAGIWLPRLDGAGRVDGRLEVRHTGIRQYRHHQFTSGQVVAGKLLGDPLGPDARGGYLSLTLSPSTWQRFALDLAMESRRGDEYTDATGGAATIDFVRTLERPAERRLRAVGTWDGTFRTGSLRLMLQGGVERVTNVAFDDDLTHTGALVRLMVEVRPGRR